MHTDYLPQSPEGLLEWLETQKTELTDELAGMIGAPVGEKETYLAAVGALKEPIAELVALRERLKVLKAGLPDVRKAQLPAIRGFVARSITRSGCTESIITRLDWAPIKHHLDLDQARPRLRAEAQRGCVRIMVKRPGFKAVSIYTRLRGEPEWTLLAPRLQKFPYFDRRPLTTPGTPEVREYRAIGVIADEEVGQPSEVQEVVFAG